MSVDIAMQHVSLGSSSRTGGGEWGFHLYDIRGTGDGPTTAFVSGVFGDKPLGCLALLQLVEELRSQPLRGRVLVIPAANLPALESGTRMSPDQLLMNRRFPGVESGAITDRLAHRIFSAIAEADCVVDLHSGMPTHALWYTYDYGDVPLSASFGLPVIPNQQKEGQLSWAVTRTGRPSILPEVAGGPLHDPAPALLGCLNVLRHRGQLDGPMGGPATVPLVGQVRVFLPSVGGILCSSLPAEEVGRRVPLGRVCWIVNPGTGEVLEEFVNEDPGAVLLLATIRPLPVRAGDLGCMVGEVVGELDVATGERVEAAAQAGSAGL